MVLANMVRQHLTLPCYRRYLAIFACGLFTKVLAFLFLAQSLQKQAQLYEYDSTMQMLRMKLGILTAK